MVMYVGVERKFLLIKYKTLKHEKEMNAIKLLPK